MGTQLLQDPLLNGAQVQTQDPSNPDPGKGQSIAPLTMPQSAAEQVAAVGPENPQTQTPEEVIEMMGLEQEDIDELIEILTQYRNQWGPDRMLRLPIWMKNVLMYRGQQVLAWDNNSGTWFDALSWYRQNKAQDGEDTNLDRWINNITLMFGTAYVGNMSRGVPLTVVRPENAEVLADVTTAEAAQEAISIIERKNRIRQMVRTEFETLYLFGSYFKFTRGVMDGNWAGYDEEPVFEDVMVQVPDRLRCQQCGKETPTAQLPLDDDGAPCPGCNRQMGPESYWPAEQKQVTQMTGTQQVPRAMVKQTVHTPLEVDVDPQAKSLAQTPILSFDQEIDLGEVRMMLPKLRERITEGEDVSTTSNANYERLRRDELVSMGYGYTSDTVSQKPTYSQNWMQPSSFFRTGKYEFAEKMIKQFPRGLKLTLIGKTAVDVRPATLVKQWSSCRLHENFGLMCPSIAERVVPFNERLNSVMQIMDDWVERASSGINLIDSARLDADKLKTRSLTPTSFIPVPMKINGEARPLSDAIAHFDMPMSAEVFKYPQLLMTFCELIACMPPQSLGSGTTADVDTATGQKQMLQQSNTALQPHWENVKEEHSIGAQNAIECLQELLKAGAVKELWEVIEAQGSQFRNNYVNLKKMEGRVKVYPDEDQDLPQTPEQIRETFQTIFEQLSKQNPAAQAIFDLPVNQDAMMTVMAPTLISPIKAQTAKTLQDINTLLDKPGQPTVGPDGSITMALPVTPDKSVEHYPTLKSTCRQFLQENCDLRVQNPEGWQRVIAYLEMAEDLEAQVGSEQAKRQGQVAAAGQPPPPPQQGPPPEQQAAMSQLLKDAAAMVERLRQVAMLDPMQTGGTVTGQVAAAKAITDSALKAQMAMAGQ